MLATINARADFNDTYKDEVEVLIERCSVVASSGPGINVSRAVGRRGAKVTTSPERLGELGVADLSKTSVDEGKEVLLGPLKTKGVDFIGEGLVEGFAFVVGLPVGVCSERRTPVKS